LRKEGVVQVQPNIEGGSETSKKKKDDSADNKGKVETHTSRNRAIKCFYFFIFWSCCFIVLKQTSYSYEGSR